MNNFKEMFKEIVQEVVSTRDCNDIEDVEKMCEKIYNKMYEEIRYKDIEIFDLKGDLIKYKGGEGWFL